jgi:hypothetical protein
MILQPDQESEQSTIDSNQTESITRLSKATNITRVNPGEHGCGNMAESSTYVVDGNSVNKLLEPYNLEAPQPTGQLHQLLPSQVYDLIQKKFIKTLSDEIEKSKAQTVNFVNLEAIATGPHKDYLYPICGGIVELISALAAKSIQVTGTVSQPYLLPWNLVAKLDKTFKGLPVPGQTLPS